MPVVQVPPAVGTSGQFIDAIVITSSTLREIIVLGDPVSSGAFATVSSSQGLQVSSTQAQTITGTVTVVSASSGLIQISGNVASASSGTVQAIHPTISAAGFGPVTSSAGLLASLSSGTIIMSSVQSVTATFATNPWSSAPGFNLPVVSVSSGLVQVLTSGTLIIVSASSGLVQALTSGTLIIVSASSGLVQTLTSGPATISGTVTVVSASSGLVQISGIPTVIVASSAGLTQTLSIVSASSGLVQIIPQSSNAMTVFQYQTSSSANSVNVQAGATALFGYSVFNSTAAMKFLHLYNTSSAPAIGSTANFMQTILIPGSTNGAGANMISPIPMNYSTKGLGFTITGGNMSATDAVVAGAALDAEVNLYLI